MLGERLTPRRSRALIFTWMMYMKQKALPNLMTGLTQLQTYFHLMINAHKSTDTVWSIFLIGKTLKQRKEHKWKVLCNNIQKHQGIFFSIIQTKGSSILFWRRLGEGGYCCNKKKICTSREITASNILFSFTNSSACKKFSYKFCFSHSHKNIRDQSLRYPNLLSCQNWKGNVLPL